MDKLNHYKVIGNYIVDGRGHHGEIVELTEQQAFHYLQTKQMRLATDEEIAELHAADKAPAEAVVAEAPVASTVHAAPAVHAAQPVKSDN